MASNIVRKLRIKRSQENLDDRCLPSTIEGAYRFAADEIFSSGKRVSAWKLGGSTEVTRRIFATSDIYFGALLENEVISQPTGELLVDLPNLKGEAEVAFRLSRNIDTAADIAGEYCLFDAWAPVIEFPWSVFSNLQEVGLRALISDRCAAGLLLIGEIQKNLDEVVGELIITADGAELTRGDIRSSLVMSPQSAAERFVGLAIQNGFRVEAGQWISTGGVTKCVDVPFHSQIELSLNETVLLSFVARNKHDA